MLYQNRIDRNMNDEHSRSMRGSNSAEIRVEWRDPLSHSKVSCALVGAIPRVFMDPDGSTHITADESAVPVEYLAKGHLASPTRSLAVHLSLSQAETIHEEIGRAIKAWRRKYRQKPSVKNT